MASTDADPAAPWRSWRFAALAALVVLVQAAASLSTRQGGRGSDESQRRGVEASARVAQLAVLLVAATNAETCSRGFVLTGDVGFLTPYGRALALETDAMRDLDSLYTKDSERQPLLHDVRVAVAAQAEYTERLVRHRRAMGPEGVTRLISDYRGVELADAVRDAIAALVKDERSALPPRF